MYILQCGSCGEKDNAVGGVEGFVLCPVQDC